MANESNSPKVHYREDKLATAHIQPVISPTHTRTKGPAPVWGSDFTTKAATIQGDSADFLLVLN